MRLMISILFLVFLMAIGFPSSGHVKASPLARSMTAVDTLEPTELVRIKHPRPPKPIKPSRSIKNRRQEAYERRSEERRHQAWQVFHRDQSEQLLEGLRLYIDARETLGDEWLDVWSPSKMNFRADDVKVAQAFSDLRRASDLGIGGASLILAYAHLEGRRVAHDAQAGLSYYNRALDILEQKAGLTLKPLRALLKDLLEKALEEYLKCVIDLFFDDHACQDDSHDKILEKARQHARAIRQAARARVICGLFSTNRGDLCFNELAFSQCYDRAYNDRGDRVAFDRVRTIFDIPFIYERSDRRPAKSTFGIWHPPLAFWSINQRRCVYEGSIQYQRMHPSTAFPQ